jgi:gluconolactonase
MPGEDAGTNGLVLDNDGNLLSARHYDGSISIIDLQNPSSITPVVSSYMGSRFNSPNDIAVHSNGGIYFTDPDYQGPSPAPQAEERAYWVPSGGTPQPIAGAPSKPNGITLSQDEATLFILGNNGLFRYPVASDGSVGAATSMTGQGGDGMGKDCAGNLYITQGNQIRVFDRDFGELTPSIPVPLSGGSVTNVAFGGSDRRTLYITSLQPPSLFSVELNVPGFPY